MNTCWYWTPECGKYERNDFDLVDQVYTNSWSMIFAGFELEQNSRMQMAIFMMWTIIIPIICMNVLIAFLG
jgi:hypothetical protein